MKFSKGFTLVEILIVVIILGILAAIVIPQFTQASNDARQSSLSSDLQTVRSQLELYRVQHLEQYPDKDNFVALMTSKTDEAGAIDVNGKFGPYLQKFPTNPFAPAAVAQTVTNGTACTGDNTSGWYFNTDTGAFTPNDNQKDASEKPHIEW